MGRLNMPIKQNEVQWDDETPQMSDVVDIAWDDAETPVTAAPTTSEIPAPRTGIGQLAGVATRGALPYATAAATGAALGSVVPGVGTAIGAAVGPVALGLTDIATGLYNVAAPAFGAARIPSGSEAIQQLGERIGVGRRPETAGQRILQTTVGGATGAGTMATGFNQLSNLVRSPVASNVLREMSKQPGVQTAAGAGAAALPAAAQEMGVTDPYVLQGLSVAGGLIGGGAAAKAGRPKPASTEQIRAAGTQAYERAKNAGVVFSPQSYGAMVDDIAAKLAKQPYRAELAPKVAAAMRALEEAKAAPQSFAELDLLRQIVGSAGKSASDNERRLAKIMVNTMDDFVAKAKPSDIVAGDISVAGPAFTEARALWTKAKRSESVERIIERAKRAPSDTSSAIRTQFRQIANSDKKLRTYSPEQQQVIKDIAQGGPISNALTAIGKISPFTSQYGPMLGLGYGGAALLSPTGAGSAAAISSTAKILADRRAIAEAQRAAQMMRGVAPEALPYNQMLVPAIMQAPTNQNALAQ
jgi:hypothetical protein